MQRSLRFWGVRGSFPGTGSQIAQHTSCVEVPLDDGHSVFCDAGTGLFPATVRRPFKRLTLLLSHFHWDHVQGFPFLNGLHDQNFEIEIFSGFPDTFERLCVLFDERFHPVPADFLKSRVKFRCLKAGEKVALNSDVNVQLAPLNHPGTSFAFRLESSTASYVYATDSDYAPLTIEGEKLMRQTDFAVMDSQFLVGDSLAKAHYGHSSFKHTIDIAAQLRIRKCALFHFDPSYSDEDIFLMEAQAKKYSIATYGSDGPEILMAREDIPVFISL